MSTLPQQGMKATETLRPEIATGREVITETHNIKSLRLAFDNGELMQNFSFLPGQVAQFGVLGTGESTFAISSPAAAWQWPRCPPCFSTSLPTVTTPGTSRSSTAPAPPPTSATRKTAASG